MKLSGTVIRDSSTFIENGSVVVDGNEIVSVGERPSIREQYPDHAEQRYDINVLSRRVNRNV
jgi:guanine deaminase